MARKTEYIDYPCPAPIPKLVLTTNLQQIFKQPSQLAIFSTNKDNTTEAIVLAPVTPSPPVLGLRATMPVEMRDGAAERRRGGGGRAAARPGIPGQNTPSNVWMYAVKDKVAGLIYTV